MPHVPRPRLLVALSIALVIGTNPAPVQAASPSGLPVAGPGVRPRGETLTDAMALRAVLGLPRTDRPAGCLLAGIERTVRLDLDRPIAAERVQVVDLDLADD